jgi:YVTN family beta-propeller protein
MTQLAAISSASRLTQPFAPGADTLELQLLPGAGRTQARVQGYDFTDHLARFEHQAQPLYLLVAGVDIKSDSVVTVSFGPSTGSTSPSPGSVQLDIAGGTLAGASFAIPGIPGGAGARLTQIDVSPDTGVPASDAWQIVALLGNTARILWVIGRESDDLRRQLGLVASQRRLEASVSRSLDWIGNDLGVPRFPPLPYSFDPDTLALFHLDDLPVPPQAEVDTVEDLAGKYVLPGNPGTNVGRLARSGAFGRFGSGFRFADANAEIRIPGLASLAAGTADSLTVECLVQPQDGAPDGHVLAKHADPANPALAGWALSVGAFGRGIQRNVRWLLSDGTAQAVLFANQSLATDHFQLIAGIVDRSNLEARLYVDGALAARAAIAALGPLTNAEPVRIGRAGSAAFQGVIDEVRLSRTARSDFHPVLGEGDDEYRRRLAIFRRWVLPTPSNLTQMLNKVVGPINGDSAPLLVDDTDSTILGGQLTLTISPGELFPGESIDLTGSRRSRDDDVTGSAPAELSFDPVFLETVSDPRLTIAPSPNRAMQRGEAPPDNRKMQRIIRKSLISLLDLLAAHPGLEVVAGFDPRAGDLRAVGRRLILQHTSVAPGELAALAHRAGFDYVSYPLNSRAISVSKAPDDYLEIAVQAGGSATAANGFDLLLGQTIVLSVDNPLPSDVSFRWVTIACGAGRGSFSVVTGAGDTLQASATGPQVTLQCTAPGEIAVKVEVMHNGRVATGNHIFRAGIASLADGASIGADGAIAVDESVAGQPQDQGFFHPVYLITHNGAHADYGSDVNDRRMQPGTAAALNRLLALIAAGGAAGNLQVLQAFVPGASDLTGVGRALTLAHTTLAPDQLGALAHAAGFTYVHRQGNQILVRQAAADLVSVSGPNDVNEGSSAPLQAAPQAAPSGVAVRQGSVYVANAGTDSLSEIDAASGLVRRSIKVGWFPVAVVLSPDGTRAYTADLLGNTISAVDLSNGSVLGRIPVGNGPVALALHPTQPRLYAACRDANSVIQIDTAALNVTASVAVGGRPVAMAIRPDGTELWVAAESAKQLSILTTQPFASATTIALPDAPAGLTILPDNSLAFVTLPTLGRMASVNVTTRAVAPPVAAGVHPVAAATASSGSAVYVVDAPTGGAAPPRLLIMSTAGALTGAVHVQADPAGIAADAAQVYVANSGADAISVIDASAMGLSSTWPIGAGLGERLSWMVHAGADAEARLSGTTLPKVSLSADRAGPLLVRAVFTIQNHSDPYTFVVRLNPALEAANAIIRKDQYDLAMNVLNAFHPVGVEVITLPIRRHVVEVRDRLLNAFPDYTYPNYRVRGPTLSRP